MTAALILRCDKDHTQRGPPAHTEDTPVNKDTLDRMP